MMEYEKRREKMERNEERAEESAEKRTEDRMEEWEEKRREERTEEREEKRREERAEGITQERGEKRREERTEGQKGKQTEEKTEEGKEKRTEGRDEDRRIRVAVITSSDQGFAGKREDLSGPQIERIVEAAGDVVVSRVILPDERELLAEQMAKIADEGTADLILTTGGTGFSPRDVMPEATLDIGERQVPGIPEAMRAYSMQFTARTMLSRAASVIRKRTLIVNLPGSPKAVRECLEFIYPQLGHGIDILTGRDGNCAR